MRLALLALALGLAVPARPAPPVWLRADVLEVGDGSTRHDVAVRVEGDRIAAVLPGASAPAGARRVAVLAPGLIAAAVLPEETFDNPAVDPERMAAELFDASLAPRWLEAGVTSVAVSPGRRRLVPGRGGLVRLGDVAGTAALTEGALVAVLDPQALDPPLLFAPTQPVNVDNPLPPARPQRPSTPMAAVAELRRLLRDPASPAAFLDVAAGRVPLRVRARREADIRRALDLVRGTRVRLVVEGAAESWKLADELASAGALVVLEVPDPALPADADQRLDTRPDAAAVLARAGVPVAVAAEAWDSSPDPLLLAAGAVRLGLSPQQAIAAITGIAARAMGAEGVGIVEPGAVADLVAFDGPALAVHSRPLLVMAAGRIAFERHGGAPPDELLLRAGRVLTGTAEFRSGRVLIRGDRIASLGTGAASPATAMVRDFGDDAVIVPGLVDAFARVGLARGHDAGGSARLRALDAIEPGHPSLRRALQSGVTAALVVPATRGMVIGSASAIATAAPAPPRDMAPAGRELVVLLPTPPVPDGPLLDVLAASAGLVVVLDDGPSDEGPRGPRLKALKEMLVKAKAYAERKAKGPTDPAAKDHAGRKHGGEAASPKPARASKQHGKAAAGDGEPGSKDSKDVKEEDKPDAMLEPWRDVLSGKARCWLRAGRADDIIPGIDAMKAVGINPVLVGAEEADLVAGDLARRGVTVVLGPGGVTRMEAGRSIEVAADLRAAGVPVALGSFGFGGSELLPLAAAASVRRGLAPEDALAALTTTAAASMGLSDVLGRLEPGRRADLVVFSGDPFEPSSRVLAVVARGRIVYEWGVSPPDEAPGQDSLTSPAELRP